MFLLAACREAPATFHGVKLGMRPDDVRARFDVPAGHWQNDGGTGGAGLKIVWQRDGQADGVERATFEFHNGLLVAVRATFGKPNGDPWLSGPKRTETASTVIARDPNGSANIRWIAKDCPEHEAEVRAILAPAP